MTGWTNTGGGDHGGDDWTISSNRTIGGDHYNIGTFTITAGVTATLSAVDVLELHAETYEIAGTLDGDGKGSHGSTDGTSDGSGTGGGTKGAAGKGGGGGGYGGDGGDGSNNADSGGITYGGQHTTTAEYGSGGGGGGTTGAFGGNGGGCVRIYGDDVNIAATADITMCGLIGVQSGSYVGGGGSGGGIYIVCNDCTIVSGATLTADGGDGLDPGGGADISGVGGGGRIKIMYYGTLTNNGTLSVAKGSTGSITGASDGTTSTAVETATCDSTYPVGQTFKTASGYPSYVAGVKIWVNAVSTAGDFTLKIWDSTSKSSEEATKTITIDSTGEKAFAFASAVLLTADTTYYFELNPDSTGDIQVAVDAYSDGLSGALYWGDNEHQGMDVYTVITGLGHVSDPVIYNNADTTVKCYLANDMLVGATHRINADGTGSISYADDFSTVKYSADKNASSGITHDTVNDEMDIADGGYLDYYIDCKYPITSIPGLTATIDVTSGTPTIQISVNGSTWYDIDTTTVDNVSTEYELDNADNLSLKGYTAFYLRFDCSATGVHSMTIKTFSLAIDIVTINVENPLIGTSGASTFTCTLDTSSALDFELSLIYSDRKWGG